MHENQTLHMAKKEDKKDYTRLRVIAEGMFVTSGMTARDIAEAIGVSEVTVSRWRQGGDGEQSWDDKRQFVRITPSRLRETLLREAERVANGEVSIVKADVVVKLLAGADKLAAKATPDVIYSVLAECCQYISTIDSVLAAKIAEHHKMFLQHKIEQEG